MLIRKQSTNQGCPVVSSHSNKHQPNLSGISLGLKSILLSGDFSVGDILAILINFNILMIVSGFNNVVGLELWSKGGALNDEAHCKFCR